MFSPALEELCPGDVSGKGQLSPRAAITLSKTDKRIANIPLNATSFAFAYPLPALADAISLSDLSQAEVAFAAIGGFVYWDESERVAAVNALQMGHGLNFEGPFPLQAQPGCRQLREQLCEAARVVKVTLGSLVASGVIGFSWILPGETFGPSEHQPELLWAHGGFVYLYEEASRKMDCLYKVTAAPQAAVDATRLNRQNIAGPTANIATAEMHRAQKLGTLGPFAPTAVHFASIGLRVSFDDAAYDVELSDTVQQQTGLSLERGEGALSPHCAITLDAVGKDAAGIPRTADTFAFAYPLRNIVEYLPRLATEDPRASFLAVGGFVYFKGRNIVGVNSLSSGYGLHFSAPLLLAASPATRTLRSALLESKRCESVQLDSLLKLGVRGVTWVLPGESFGEGEVCWPHGAFVYLFDWALRHHDCMYVLEAEPPVAMELRERMRRVAFEAAASKAEANLVSELYGNDIVAQIQRRLAAQLASPKSSAKKVGQLGPFRTVTIDHRKIDFAVEDTPEGGTYSIAMAQLPAPPPPEFDRFAAAVVPSTAKDDKARRRQGRLARRCSRGPSTAEGLISSAEISSAEISSAEMISSAEIVNVSTEIPSIQPPEMLQLTRQTLRQRLSKVGTTVSAAINLKSAGLLPAGWAEALDATGQTYYWNMHSRETRWARPRLLEVGGPPLLSTTTQVSLASCRTSTGVACGAHAAQARTS